MLNIPQNQPTRRAAFLFQDEDDVFDTGGGQDRSLTTDFLLRTAGGQEVFAGDDLSAGLFFEFEAGAFGDAAAFFFRRRSFGPFRSRRRSLRSGRSPTATGFLAGAAKRLLARVSLAAGPLPGSVANSFEG